MATVSFLGPVHRGKSKKTEIKRVANSVTNLARKESVTDTEETKDYFVERNGLRFAGTHLLLDLWNAPELDNIELIDAALREAVRACSPVTSGWRPRATHSRKWTVSASIGPA